MKKRELVEDFRERIGEHYFQLLQFISIINLVRQEIDLSEDIDKTLDKLNAHIEMEVKGILLEDVNSAVRD